MMLNPKISVIVPIYNVEKYLRQCLDSILEQTLKSLEIILIDDGSTDQSGQIAEDYALKDKRIYVIHQQNSGYGKAVNVGIKKAKGQYIAIVEPDDYIAPEMYEDLFKIAQKNKSDVVKSNFYVVEEWIRGENIRLSRLPIQNYPSDVFKIKDFPILFSNHPSIWSCLYQRDFLIKNNIKMKEVKGSGWTDNPFQIETLCLARKINYTPKAYYYWRTSLNQVDKINNWHYPIDRTNEIHKWMQEHQIDDPQILSALYQREMSYIYLVFKMKKIDDIEACMEGLQNMCTSMKEEVVLSKNCLTEQSQKIYKEILIDPFKAREKYLSTYNKKIGDKCTGCGACDNICPVKAIKMIPDEEGFIRPVIDEKKCIHCGLCEKVCPIFTPKQNTNFKPECYAVMGDDELRMKSSSGGMFGILAEYVIKQKGYVCGAAYDKDWTVHHIIVHHMKDLEKLRKSKYVQSRMESCFKKIKEHLEKGKLVLFSGTPCQVSGLKNYLIKDYENLITVDLLCHGVPSEGVWKKYLKENFDITQINQIDFRDKEVSGWSCKELSVTLRNGQKVVSDLYTNLFHQSIILRKSCHMCQFSRLPREADFSLGDFWGISQYDRNINDGKGVSLVLLNNMKAKELFEKLNIDKQYQINLDQDYNNGHIYESVALPSKRDLFFNDFAKFSYNQAAVAVRGRYDVCLTSIGFASNYGSAVVGYAVYKTIENLGYTVLMLQKPSFLWTHAETLHTIQGRFMQRHYHLSKEYHSYLELSDLNNYADTFVVGSDQLFNPGLGVDFAYLEFAGDDKKKIAFGSSFGHDCYRATPELIKKRQYLFDRFDGIALRETSENLCQNIFHLNAVEIIDPTLILPLEEYQKLSTQANLGITEPYLLTYMLDLTQEKVDALHYLAEKLGLKIININNLDFKQRKDLGLEYLKDYTPEEFLWLYQNASFVVTDSFHGTCFSVKFNKPFVSFINMHRGKLRYKLFDVLGICDRIMESPAEVYDNDFIFKKINYKKINQIIEEKASFARQWLSEALKKEKQNKPTSKDIYYDLKFKELLSKIENQQKQISRLNKQNPKVSIIVPVYNTEKYLKKCLDSILAQKLKEIEIICINDGSTDDSLDILYAYKAKDSRVKVINKTNTGYGATMNLGLDLANGEYIGIVESDDYILPDMYQDLYSTAQKHNADIVKSDFYSVEGGRQRLTMLDPSKTLYRKVINPQKNMNVFKPVMNTWCGIYKRSFLDAYRIRHHETSGASFQDVGFWFKTMAFASCVYFLDKPCYVYGRDNPNSSINDFKHVLKMKDEFTLLEKEIRQYDHFKKFIPAFWWRKFQNYSFTLEKVEDKSTNRWLKTMRTEFKSKECDLSLFDNDTLKQIKLLRKSSRKFYKAWIKDRLFEKEDLMQKIMRGREDLYALSLSIVKEYILSLLSFGKTSDGHKRKIIELYQKLMEQIQK